MIYWKAAKVVIVIVAIVIAAMLGLILGEALSQEKAPNQVALTQQQKARIGDLMRDAALARARLEAAQKEVTLVQMRYKDLVRDFADELTLSLKEWRFDDETASGFVKINQAAPAKTEGVASPKKE